MGKNLQKKYFHPLTSRKRRRRLALPVFLTHCLEAVFSAFFLLFHPAHKSFGRESFRSRHGVYHDSFYQHKNHKSGARYFAVSTLMILLTAGLLVHLVVFSFFPNGIQPALAASSFTVNDLGDGTDANPGDGVCEVNVGLGDCTLRAAIEETNADVSGAPHDIDFSVSGTINVGSATFIALPAITNNDTNINVPAGQQIILSGTRFLGAGSGLEIDADDCDITADDFGGLRIIFFPDHGIELTGADNAYVENVWIGTRFGNTAEPNSKFGIAADIASGDLTLISNVICANQFGGVVSPNAGTLTTRDNLIGTDSTGAAALGNSGNGLSKSNGTLDADGDTISANEIGLRVSGSGHTIKNVKIGTDSTGRNNLGNEAEGIWLSASNSTVDGAVVGNNGWNYPFGPNHNSAIYVSGTGNSILNTHVGIDPDGGDIGNDHAGIWIEAGASNNTVQNCEIGNNDQGVYFLATFLIVPTSGVQIINNFIGLDAAGNSAPNGYGLLAPGIFQSDNFLIRDNVISNQTGGGLSLASFNNLVLQDNKIGTNIAGDAAAGNGDEGTALVNSDTATISGNTISGNGDKGISVAVNSTNIDIYDNHIGTNAAGDAALGNGGAGISLDQCTDCRVGAPGQENVISANDSGVEIWRSPNTEIEENYIGVGADGTTLLGNVNYGVAVGEDSDSTLVSENVIADSDIGVGVGPYFGGALSQFVTITQNSIYANSTQGIHLEPGANESIEAPAVYKEEYDPVTDTYDVYVKTPYSGATVELFSDAGGQGKAYKGDKVSTSPVEFNSITKDPGTQFTATVTNSNGSTSVFGGPDSSPPASTADPTGGTYNIPLTVTLDAQDDWDPSPVIHYTTDGSAPDGASDSCVKTCAIDIAETTALKFRAVDSAGNWEAVNTEDYVISSAPSGIGLEISGVSAYDIGSTHATISWETNKYSDSKVYYGKTPAMNKSRSNSAHVIDHEIGLAGLDPDTTYYYQVESSTTDETARSAVKTFKTFKKEIDPPEITSPEDGAHYFTLYMTHNDEPITVEMQNPVLTDGKNRVYVDGEKQKNEKNEKKYAKIGSDGASEFDVGVKNNDDVARNDGHKITADAVNTNGNTSQKSGPTSFAMGSTHSSGTISFAPRVSERPADMVNTTLVPRPTIASYFPGVEGAQVFVYKKSTADSGYVLDGTTGASGDPSGIMNFSYKFFLSQPPGTISVYFKVKDSNGVVQYESDPFSLVYYQGCPATWQGAVVDVQTTYDKPWLTFLMCHTQEYEIFIDGVFNGSGKAPSTASGTASIAYLPFLPLAEGDHSLKIRTFESYGYPYSDTDAVFNVAATGFGGGGAPPAPAPEPPPEPAPASGPGPVPGPAPEEKGEVGPGPDFQTEEVIELTDEEKQQLKRELTESLAKNTGFLLNMRGLLYQGELVDGVVKFCIRKCLYPSLTDQDVIEVNGQLDISEKISQKLEKAGAEATTELALGETVQVAKVNRTGEWSMTVPLSELPEGEVDARVRASTNGVDSDSVTVAKFQAQEEPVISNTSILIFANLGLAVIALLAGGVVYQRRKRRV